MSEYQYYEFSAIDRRLDSREMKELRALSTRAEITPTSFVNEYHWGDFKGDPRKLMHRYFDAFVYVANWGTHRLMFRLPRGLIDERAMTPYFPGEGLDWELKGDQAVLEFRSENEDGDWEEGVEGLMESLVPLREDLLAGDYRALYLGWLAVARSGDIEDTDAEPPVPSGLGELSAPLTALAEFLRVDRNLIAAAAQRSAGKVTTGPGQEELGDFIDALPGAEKNRLLLRLAESDGLGARRDLLERFRQSRPIPAPQTAEGGRTVAELFSAADAIETERLRAEADRKARAAARRAREEAAAREEHLNGLAGRELDLWRQVEFFIVAKPARYDSAVALLRDLKDLAARSAGQAHFSAELAQFRDRHAKKRTLLSRLDKAGLRAADPKA